MNRRPSSRRVSGFSLVEIALALGIASFALVALVGLLRVALDSDSTAGRDTALAAMSAQIMNEMRSTPFDALWAAKPAEATSAPPTTNAPADTIYYFTSEGTRITGDEAASDIQAAYQCVVKKTVDPHTQSPGLGIYNRLLIQLQFSWPALAGNQVPLRTNTQIINASIARY